MWKSVVPSTAGQLGRSFACSLFALASTLLFLLAQIFLSSLPCTVKSNQGVAPQNNGEKVVKSRTSTYLPFMDGTYLRISSRYTLSASASMSSSLSTAREAYLSVRSEKKKDSGNSGFEEQREQRTKAEDRLLVSSVERTQGNLDVPSFPCGAWLCPPSEWYRPAYPAAQYTLESDSDKETPAAQEWRYR